MKELELTPVSDTRTEINDLQYWMGYKYRKSLWQIFYAYITDRLDIFYDVTDISNFDKIPGDFWYGSIKRVVSYLRKKPQRVLSSDVEFQPGNLSWEQRYNLLINSLSHIFQWGFWSHMGIWVPLMEYLWVLGGFLGGWGVIMIF